MFWLGLHILIDKVKPKTKRKEEPSSIFQRQRVDALLLDLRQKFPPRFVQVMRAYMILLIWHFFPGIFFFLTENYFTCDLKFWFSSLIKKWSLRGEVYKDLVEEVGKGNRTNTVLCSLSLCKLWGLHADNTLI